MQILEETVQTKQNLLENHFRALQLASYVYFPKFPKGTKWYKMVQKDTKRYKKIQKDTKRYEKVQKAAKRYRKLRKGQNPEKNHFGHLSILS